MAFSDDSLGFNLNRTNTKMKNAWAQELKPFGVTPEQCAVLFCLWEKDGVTPKELAFSVSKDAPTTVRIVERLARKDLLRSEADPVDKRSYRVFLTTQGKAIQERITDLAMTKMRKALNGIKTEDEQLLMKLLKQIYDNLGS